MSRVVVVMMQVNTVVIGVTDTAISRIHERSRLAEG